MGGTLEGGLQAAKTNKQKYGADYYARIGALGGAKGRTGGFGSPSIGADGLTGRQRASIHGRRGGFVSSRAGVPNQRNG